MLSTVQTHLKRQSLLQRVERIYTSVLSPYFLMLLFFALQLCLSNDSPCHSCLSVVTVVYLDSQFLSWSNASSQRIKEKIPVYHQIGGQRLWKIPVPNETLLGGPFWKRNVSCILKVCLGLGINYNLPARMLGLRLLCFPCMEDYYGIFHVWKILHVWKIIIQS